MNVMVFAGAALFLLALPLVILLVWAIGRESRLRREQQSLPWQPADKPGTLR